MRKLAYAVGLGALVLLAVLVIRTLRFDSKQIVVPPEVGMPVDTAAAAQHLSRALQFQTVTKRDPAELDSAAYRGLHRYLQRTYPRVHATLERMTVSDLSVLYTWPGQDTTRAPVVFMAHTDVVPVEAGTDTTWTHAPFSGAMADGFVWGRGALDDKASAIGMLEAVEQLIEEGMQPRRTIHLALGHDEEVGGTRGARVMAERIARGGVRPALVIDEGGAITDGAVPRMQRPVALVGVAEKGYLSVEIIAESRGGHAAMPPAQTSVEIVSEAVARLGEQPLEADLGGVTGQTFRYLAPEMGVLPRMAFANRWLTEPLLTWGLSRNPTTNAAIRTTTAPTMIEGGVKDNVIPTTARAVVNFRVVPGQGIKAVMDHVRATLADLPVRIEKQQHSAPSPVSAIDARFQRVQRAIQHITPDTVAVAPLLVPGTTDARHYAPYSDHVYRFLPFRLTPADQGRIHGTDERIALADLAAIVAFYRHLIRTMDPAHR